MAWPVGAPAFLEIETGDPVEKDSPARFVTWIPWDSGFRGSGLRVGDLVVGHGDVRYTPEVVERKERVGDPSFSRWFEAQHLKPGAPFTLRVDRDGDEIALEGLLGGPRSYTSPDGKRWLAPGGPVGYEKDGFDYAWSAWYDQFVSLAKTVLAGWDYFTGTNTRSLSEEVAPFADRIAFLEKQCPGPFAQAVRDDYEAMKKMVAGSPRALSPADLAYRTLGEVRARQVSQAADRALAAFWDAVKDQVPKDLPDSPHAFRQNIRPWVGKTVRLSELGPRQILFETQASWYWSGRNDGGFVVNRRSAALTPFAEAIREYREKVDPSLRDLIVTIVGEIQEEPALVVDPFRSITVAGVRVEPRGILAARVDDTARRFFVDLRTGRQSDERFAGERALEAGIPRLVLSDADPPEKVFMTAVEALKVGNKDLWLSCYATWLVRRWYHKDGSYAYVDRTWDVMGPNSSTGAWDQARRRLLDDVYGVEVASVSPSRVVYDATQPGADPRSMAPHTVEEVRLTVNYVGKFGDEYRTFGAPLTHRRWTVQRLDRGPWRIASEHAL